MRSEGISRKTFSFGACTFAKTSPPVSEPKVLNIAMTFEEALKLSLAVDECVRRLNSYNRSTTKGKRAALNLAIHLHKARISVNQTNLS